MTDTERAAWAAFEQGIVEDASAEMARLRRRVAHLELYITVSESYLHDYLRDLRTHQEFASRAYEELEEQHAG